MQSHRIMSGLTVFLMVILVAVGYFFVAQPQLAAAADANVQLGSVQAQIVASQSTVATLKKQQQQLPELKQKLAALRLSIPSTVDGSAYINGLNAVAGAAGVTITGITVADAQSYVPPASPVTTTPATGASAAPTPTPSAAPAPVVTGWSPTTDPLITPTNFVVIPVKVATSGTFDGTLAFLKGLQTGTRLFLVSGFSTSRSADNPNTVLAEISGYIYVIVDHKAAATSDATTPTPTPSPTATPTPSATPSPSGSASPTPTPSPTSTKKP